MGNNKNIFGPQVNNLKFTFLLISNLRLGTTRHIYLIDRIEMILKIKEVTSI